MKGSIPDHMFWGFIGFMLGIFAIAGSFVFGSMVFVQFKGYSWLAIAVIVILVAISDLREKINKPNRFESPVTEGFMTTCAELGMIVGFLIFLSNMIPLLSRP